MAAEVSELEVQGWFSLCDHIPPSRSGDSPAQGWRAAPRHHRSGRAAFLTIFGLPVHSLNERSLKGGRLGGEPKTTPEKAAGNHACLLRLWSTSPDRASSSLVDFRYFSPQFLFETAHALKMRAVLPSSSTPGGGMA